jgi:hypothetical protein
MGLYSLNVFNISYFKRSSGFSDVFKGGFIALSFTKSALAVNNVFCSGFRWFLVLFVVFNDIFIFVFLNRFVINLLSVTKNVKWPILIFVSVVRYNGGVKFFVFGALFFVDNDYFIILVL